jgi:hypothetical protein
MGRRSSILIVLTLVFATGACGRGGDEPAVATPSETEISVPVRASRASPPPALPPSRRATASPVRPGFSETTAVSCDGRPSVEQVGALVKSILKNAKPTVAKGPLCSGTWQYTVLTVADAEPLQVVSKGAPTALVLVTAGTNPCTPDVRGAAPPGLLTATGC